MRFPPAKISRIDDYKWLFIGAAAGEELMESRA